MKSTATKTTLSLVDDRQQFQKVKSHCHVRQGLTNIPIDDHKLICTKQTNWIHFITLRLIPKMSMTDFINKVMNALLV